jgi:hypothetical protein
LDKIDLLVENIDALSDIDEVSKQTSVRGTDPVRLPSQSASVVVIRPHTPRHLLSVAPTTPAPGIKHG